MNKEKIILNAEIKVGRLLEQYRQYKSLSAEMKLASPDSPEMALLKRELGKISDSMTFDDPIVWMMYKERAYKDSDHSLANFGIFRAHCMKPGDICTKRFAFLNSYLISSRGQTLHDKNEFPSDMETERVYSSDPIIEAVFDPAFIKAWMESEYFIKDGRVAKWQNQENQELQGKHRDSN